MLSVIIIMAGVASVFLGITGRYTDFWNVIRGGLSGTA